MKGKEITISGKVQGVGFREFIRREVGKLGGLAGYAKNLKSGDVKVVISGEDKKIKTLVEKCKKGPLLAYVKNISVENIETEEDFDSFFVKP